MPICSFHIETNIVIPTCTSDRFPPVLPSLALLPTSTELTSRVKGDLCLPVSGCRVYDTGSKGSNLP